METTPLRDISDLPNEILVMVFEYARGYSPALRSVCRLWRELATGAAAPLGELAWLGHRGLIGWIAAARRGPFPVSQADEMLAGAALGGHRVLCHRMRDLGALNFDMMMHAAATNGHLAVAMLARAWGASNLDNVARTAAAEGHLEIVLYTIAEGASAYSEVALSAARHGHAKIVDAVRGLGPVDENSVLAGATEGGHVALIDDALARGASDFSWMYFTAAAVDRNDLVDRARALAEASEQTIDYRKIMDIAVSRDFLRVVDYVNRDAA